LTQTHTTTTPAQSALLSTPLSPPPWRFSVKCCYVIASLPRSTLCLSLASMYSRHCTWCKQCEIINMSWLTFLSVSVWPQRQRAAEVVGIIISLWRMNQ
jgi:hypothetical protein